MHGAHSGGKPETRAPAEALRKKPWRVAFTAAWERMRGGELTAARAAASVAVGLFIGVTPLWGTHFLLVMAVCVPLRLDVVLAYVASNISLPFIAPFLTFAEVELGARALTGSWMPAPARSLEAFRAHDLLPFVKELAIGTALFAPMVAGAGYAVTYGASRWVERRVKEGLGPLLNEVAERYARGRKGTRIYVRSKMMGDPVVRAVSNLGGARGELGEVVDVGCGRGQLALVLVLGAGATRVTGIDWDEGKIEEARRAATGLEEQVSFEQGDVRSARVPSCDTVLLIDVLHYLSAEDQDALLGRAADAARRRVVLRELDPERGWRSNVTRLQEWVTTSIGFNRGARLVHRPVRELVAPLEARGFTVDVRPCWQGTPFSNVLVVATRDGESIG